MMDDRIPFGFASQGEVQASFRDGDLPATGTLLCLRRTPPAWWPDVRSALPGLSMAHVPIPPSIDPDCAARLAELLQTAIPRMQRPVIVFCKEGRHRSGMVQALVNYLHGASLNAAEAIYLRRSGSIWREREVAIVRQLAQFFA